MRKSSSRRKPDVRKKRKSSRPRGSAPDQVRGARSRPIRERFPIVGIGASAGGLEAFTQLLKDLPPDTGMGYVLVQHLDPDHESQLTQILSRVTSLPVREIENDEPVKPNHVYVIPRDTSLSLAGGVLKIRPRERTRRPHRPIDSFFESLAQDQRERAVGVVLSGTATDGTLGLEAIKAEGGITFAQDGSAKQDSMPRSAVAAGCVDLVLSPGEIAKELARIARHPYVAGDAPILAHADTSAEEDRARATAHQGDGSPLPSGGNGTPRAGGRQARAEAERSRGGREADIEGEVEPGNGDQNGYKKILLLLRNHSGVDFTLYKSTTIQRRINRRLVLNKQNTHEAYARLLRGSASELDALFSDVLIGVTSFFRNPETFHVLETKVFPELLRHSAMEPLRCWVLGCSTGQEAYSIAMAFVEAADKAPRERRLQIFATDLNDALLDKARQGLYAKSLADDISPQRLRRFFVEEQGGYRVVKSLREMVVFARQNLIADPPFSRMDLISCRNLLIYLDPALQQKAIPTFHYALKPHGFLLLGASESVGSFAHLFETVDKKHKIYSRKLAPTSALALPLKRARGEEQPVPRPPLPIRERGDLSAANGAGELDGQREADRVTLNRFAPPSVLVNAELQVLQFRGPTGRFLAPPVGKATFDVLKMAREGLMLPLRSAINQARKENKSARRENVRVKENGGSRAVSLEVIPLRNQRERCFLILFEDAGKAKGNAQPDHAAQRGRPGARTGRQVREESSRIAELEAELTEMREYMQSMQEQHEAANEEVQSANEEVQSANEELQSINEELETSKEELESANEELTTLNEEMSNRNIELNQLNNDLVNLQSSTKLSIILFGRDLSIRRFSREAEKDFDLLAADVGRPISHIRHGLVDASRALSLGKGPAQVSPRDRDLVNLESLVTEVIAEVSERELEVLDNSRRWRSLRVRPYMTGDGKVDGVVLLLLDIDAVKRSELAVAAARDYAEGTIDTVREPLLVLDRELRVESANRSFYRVFRLTPSEAVGTFIYDLGDRQWDIQLLLEKLAEVASQGESIVDFEVEHDLDATGRRSLLLSARRIQDPRLEDERILVAIEDVTDKRRAEAATSRLAAIVESSEDAIISMTLDGTIITSWNRSSERLFGYTAEEATGQPISLIIPLERRSEEDDVIARLRRAECVEHFDSERQTKDGRRICVSLTMSPIKDARGQIIGASKTARDITEEKRIEKMMHQSEERYRTLVAQIKDYAIFRTDVQGRATTWNEGVKRVLGFDESEFIGQNITKSIFTPEDIDKGVPQRELDLAAKVGTVSNDRWMRRKSGEHFSAAGATTALRGDDGELVGFTKIMLDQTERVRAEEALRQSHAELRMRASELTRFNRVAVGRESRMIELKQQINELHERLGDSRRYPLELGQSIEPVMAEPPRPPGVREGLVPLQSILRTEELKSRPLRPPDHEAEERVWAALGRRLADSPRTILQSVVEEILVTLRCGSAGFSLLTPDEQRFVWPAIAGSWQLYVGRGTPRDFGPSRDVLDCNGPLLFTHFERRYPYLQAMMPAAEECLLIPFQVEDRVVGTIWAIAHDDSRRFDAEDLRQLESIGRFASAAYQAVEMQQVQASRRSAALNVMEDAVEARMTIEQLNQELRESEERFRYTLEATQLGQWDLDLVADQATRSLRHDQIFGYDAVQPEWGLRFFIDKHVHPDDRAQVSQSFQEAVVQAKPWEFECRIIRTDNAVRWIWAKGSIYSSRDGKPQRMLGLIMDITQRKELEEALRRSSVDLLEAAGRRNEFLAMLGHELRNPLTALAHGLELLGRVLDNHAQSEELRAMMVRQTVRIGSMLDQLLDIARVISGKVRISKKPVAVVEAVRAAVETVSPLLQGEQHNLTLTVPRERADHDLVVLGDAIRLTQVVENLLTNAAKYTHQGGRIELLLEGTGELVRIKVRDNGIGMSSEFLPHVFEVFTQAPRTLDRAKGGLGLGLPLVKRLVEMHGGHVSASSPGLGEGSEFVVTLPRMAENDLRSALDQIRPSSGSGNIGPHRILVVDDERDMAGAFAELLEANGHTTLAVNDGPSALEAARTFKPEIVLLDLGLPQMDGYEVARRLREEYGETKMLLIAVTGYQADRARLQQAGFNFHLIKPPNPQNLYVLLAEWERDT